jgi:hypothetical protein
MTFTTPLCVEKRYEIMKAAFSVDITGATPATISCTWSARFNREGRATTFKVLKVGTTEFLYSAGQITQPDANMNRNFYPVVVAHSATGPALFAWGSFIHNDK